MCPDNPADYYDKYYFAHCCGIRYQRDDTWLEFFNSIAARIASEIRPATALDAGCAIGLLVESLRQHNIEAWGIDISEYAIQNVHPTIRPYCWAGDVTAPLPRNYDLIVCIEVLEHLAPQQAELAVRNLCQHSADILFSSTPFDYKEATHVNVQPPEYWASLFARFDFYHDLDYDAAFVTPWAMRFRKLRDGIPRVISSYERRLWRLTQETNARREYNLEQRNELADKESKLLQGEATIQGLAQEKQALLEGFAREKEVLTESLAREKEQRSEKERMVSEKEAMIQGILNSRSWRLMKRVQQVRKRIIPEGSRREKMLFLFFLSLGILRREGFLALFHRVRQKLSWSMKVLWATIRHKYKRAQPTQPLEIGEVEQPAASPAHQASLDIAICVHNALEDLKHCLAAVQQNSTPPYRIILIDDGSGPETRDFLIDFATEHGCMLVRNEEAQGYTKAANQGLRLSEADFVILLNSDTIVTPGWLDNMVACAQSDPKIGLVGPVSNTASWQSIPSIESDGDWAANPLPPGITIEAMGTLVAKYSARLYPKMPLLNGFCLMIRSQTIQEIGYFDEENFGVGYGEENDYCLRARKAGWLLALADDTYIYHAQSKSYTIEKRKLLSERAGVVLARKHGHPMINTSVAYCWQDRILQGMRARSRVIHERDHWIARGQMRFAGRRVAFILPAQTAGGGANIILSEALAMQKMGVEVSIINLPSNRYDFEHSYQDVRVPIHYAQIDDIPAALQGYNAAIATFNPSVGWLASARKKSADLIIGYYVQDFEPFFYPSESESYRAALNSYSQIPDMVRFTKTDWTRKTVENQAGVPCQVIGVDYEADLFLPRPRPDPEWPERPLRIGAMIRPSSPRRGPALTMDLLQQASHHYGSRIEVRLFGTLPNDPGFLTLRRDFAWRLAGILNPGQVASFLNEVDLFVDFSSYQAMGLASLEAMACGAAVIVPLEGGSTTFAIDGENSLVVDTSTREKCWAALQQLIEDHNLRLKIQQNSIQQIVQYFPELPAYNILACLFEPPDRAR